MDGRTTLAKDTKRWKDEVRRDLGGSLSRAQETLLELAAQTWVQVSSLDAWLGKQPSLVLNRKRTVVPVLLERQRLADSLERTLERLGLERRPSSDTRELLRALQAPSPSAVRSHEPEDACADLAPLPDPTEDACAAVEIDVAPLFDLGIPPDFVPEPGSSFEDYGWIDPLEPDSPLPPG